MGCEGMLTDERLPRFERATELPLLVPAIAVVPLLVAPVVWPSRFGSRGHRTQPLGRGPAETDRPMSLDVDRLPPVWHRTGRPGECCNRRHDPLALEAATMLDREEPESRAEESRLFSRESFPDWWRHPRPYGRAALWSACRVGVNQRSAPFPVGGPPRRGVAGRQLPQCRSVRGQPAGRISLRSDTTGWLILLMRGTRGRQLLWMIGEGQGDEPLYCSLECTQMYPATALVRRRLPGFEPEGWWTWGDSNPRLPHCQCGALQLSYRPASSVVSRASLGAPRPACRSRSS